MGIRKVLKKSKGFTLIEIIVVLVILAILAAATIPAMLGFVDDARGKAFAAEARVGLVAAQAVVTEVVATGDTRVDSIGSFTSTDGSPKSITVASGSSTETVGRILDHPTFKNMTNDVTGGSISFQSIEVDPSNSRVTGVIYHSATAAPYYRVVITSSAGATVSHVKN